MKKCELIIFVCLGFMFNLNAQGPSSGRLKENSTVTSGIINPLHSDLIILTSENNYLARTGSVPQLNRVDSNNLLRSQFYNLNSEFTADIPKHAYGFHNGRLLLRSTGATSSGTITGSGSVGTGSSLGNIGSTGSGIGLNGKTPDAGSGMWGNARGFVSIPREKKIVSQ